MTFTRGVLYPCLAVIFPLLFSWLGSSVLIIAGRGDIEGLLARTFGRHARPDAFEHLGRVAALFWIAQTSLASVAVLATWRNRTDVVIVLSIGPAIALTLCAVSQEWSDPNWFVVVSVSMIGWLVSTLVGGGYWLVFPNRQVTTRGVSSEL